MRAAAWRSAILAIAAALLAPSAASAKLNDAGSWAKAPDMLAEPQKTAWIYSPNSAVTA